MRLSSCCGKGCAGVHSCSGEASPPAAADGPRPGPARAPGLVDSSPEPETSLGRRVPQPHGKQDAEQGSQLIVQWAAAQPREGAVSPPGHRGLLGQQHTLVASESPSALCKDCWCHQLLFSSPSPPLQDSLSTTGIPRLTETCSTLPNHLMELLHAFTLPLLPSLHGRHH